MEKTPKSQTALKFKLFYEGQVRWKRNKERKRIIMANELGIIFTTRFCTVTRARNVCTNTVVSQKFEFLRKVIG